MTISCGVTLLTTSDSTVDALVTRADAGLYQAKQAGRNRVVMVALGGAVVHA